MTYYDILGVSNDASADEIIQAYEYKMSLACNEHKSLDEKKKIDFAFNILNNSKKRDNYDLYLKVKRRKKRKKIRISIVALAFVSYVGYCVVKDSKVNGYISELPDYLSVGSYCSKDSRISNSDMEKDFILIEIPDYDEDVSEKSRFIKNITKCITNNKDFGLYIKTSAKTEEEFKTIIYRFDSLSKRYKWFCAYPIIIDLDYQNDVESKELSSIINNFNNLLKTNGWFSEFCIRKPGLDLSSDIKTVFISNNERLTDDKLNNNSAFTYNSGFFSRTFGNSDFNSMSMNIYSRNYIEEIIKGNFNGYSNEKYYVGIDISGHQKNVDWDKFYNKIDFAICRICDFYGYDSETKNFSDVLDTTYLDKISNCVKYDIPFASYYFTRANTIQKAKDEANEIVKYMKDNGLVGSRIYLDFESYKNTSIADLLINADSKAIEIIMTAKNIIEEAGFEFGLYVSNSDLNDINYIGEIKDIPLWVSNYGSDVKFDINSNIDSFGCIKSYALPRVTNPTSCELYIHQITQNGIVDGIGNAEGKIDINLIPVSNGLDGFVTGIPKKYQKLK